MYNMCIVYKSCVINRIKTDILIFYDITFLFKSAEINGRSIISDVPSSWIFTFSTIYIKYLQKHKLELETKQTQIHIRYI